MPAYITDFYGHVTPNPAPTLPGLALSNNPSTAVGFGPLATSGTGGAGAGSTVTYNGGSSVGVTAVDTLGTAPNDARGQFILTAAGTPVAGLVAQVNFKQPYSQPVTVVASCVDTTATPNVSVPIGVVLSGAAPGATTGFQLASTPALTAAHAYLISYSVIS